MSELAPPNQIRSGPPSGPTRDVKRVARMRDHEADGQTQHVTARHGDEHDGQGYDEPAVVVSHPSAAVSIGEQLEGHVVELTPRNQPVLQTDRLRLLLDAQLPLPLNTQVELIIMAVEPTATARILAVNDERLNEGAVMPVMVLALSAAEASAPSPAPTGYAANPAMLRAKMMRESGD